jgi:hypothetical protein
MGSRRRGGFAGGLQQRWWCGSSCIWLCAESIAASPTPSPVQPIALSGTNSKVTDPMDIPPGNYRVSWQATDTQSIGGSTLSELFEVYVQGQQKTNIINEVLPTTPSGEALFSSAGGSFIVDVEVSSATWKITFTWLSP